MPDMSEDLRGSAPIYSAKDILIKLETKIDTLDGKVDELHTSMQVLTSQELAVRISRIESWQQRVIGMAAVSTLLALAATAMTLFGALLH